MHCVTLSIRVEVFCMWFCDWSERSVQSLPLDITCRRQWQLLMAVLAAILAL